jgi:hypothetical protein
VIIIGSLVSVVEAKTRQNATVTLGSCGQSATTDCNINHLISDSTSVHIIFVVSP